jgi:iron complex transport system substrate-binding protein
VTRIVSLLASGTEIVDALGMMPSLVGRSHECDFPPQVKELPCCTRPSFDVSGNSRDIDAAVKHGLRNALSIYEVLDDVLERLQPTHIVTQTQCEVCAVSLRDVERSIAGRLASCPKIVSLQPNSLADIWEDVRRVACALGIEARGEEVVGSLQGQMRTLAERSGAGRLRPTVACVEWLEPLLAAGNWMPELIEMAGGVNQFGEAGRHSPWLSWEELAGRDPDVVIVAPCGFPLERTAEEMYWMTRRPGWGELRAVREGRVYVADGNRCFHRPGPGVVGSLVALAEMLRGGEEGRWWKRWERAV